MTSKDSVEMHTSGIYKSLSNLDGDLLAHYGLEHRFEITCRCGNHE